jgi:hypothetical protein
MLQWTLALAAVLAFTALAVAWTLIRERRRAQRVAQTARELGLSFHPDGRFLLGEGFDALPLFALARIARWASIQNVMQGTIDSRRMVICDYHYATGSPSNRNDYYHTIAAFRIGGGVLPEFAVRLARPALARAVLSGPLGAALIGLLPSGRAIGTALAAADEQRIEIAAPAAFAERYVVSGSDRAAVLRRLRPPLLEYLASRPEPLFVESAGGWLAVFRRHYVAPAALAEFLAEAREFVRRLVDDH